MTDTIPTPANWHWAITPQDIAKLRLTDVDTMNKVYFANYPKFRKIAYNRFNHEFAEDALQSIYLALPCLDYTNSQTFFISLLQVVRNLVYGTGRVYSSSLEGMEDRSERDGETLPSYLMYSDRYFTLEDEEKIIDFLKCQKSLTEKEKDLFCATAFGIYNYKGVFEDECNFITSKKAF